MAERANFLNLNGIPSDTPPRDGSLYFFFDPLGVWRVSAGDRSYDIDGLCTEIHDKFQQVIMKGIQYDYLVYMLPQFVSISGLDSESPLTRDKFEAFLAKYADFPEINRFLYLYDCERLVSSIQACMLEVTQIMGEFYYTLNTEDLPFSRFENPDGIRFCRSPVVTKLFSYLSFIFIRMHSLLDYNVKVSFEAERIQTDFTNYPRTASLSKQFGARKRISFNGAAGTLFEDCEFVTMVETLRNHVIHDGLLDAMPKAYEKIENGKIVEKFILFPDMSEGRLDRFKNRNLFFGKEDRINYRIPSIFSEFQSRQESTLCKILEVLDSKL